MDEQEIALRNWYEQEAGKINATCEAIEASTEDYWTIQDAIKANNEALAILYKEYMRKRNALKIKANA